MGGDLYGGDTIRKGGILMKVQVKNEGMIYLPAQAMAAFSIREQDFLDCSLTQTGILLTPIFLAGSMAGLKKNWNYR